jgi:hypothetical protein
MSELTRNKLRTRIFFIYFGRERERCGKPVARYEVGILHELTIPYGGVRRNAQDLAAALPRKHMHYIPLAHECVALVHVDVAGIPDADVERLHEGTRAYVVQGNISVGRY